VLAASTTGRCSRARQRCPRSSSDGDGAMSNFRLPHTFNFAEAAELAVQARAAMRAADIRQGVVYAAMLAIDPQRNGWVERALTFASRHRGATERMAERIVGLLPAVI
jgi:hypothetical protein